MKEITGAELSLAVARIMYSEYEWKVHRAGVVYANIGADIYFNYKDKDYAWDMAVWLANNKLHKETSCLDIYVCQKDPQHALAMAILEIDRA